MAVIGLSQLLNSTAVYYDYFSVFVHTVEEAVITNNILISMPEMSYLSITIAFFFVSLSTFCKTACNADTTAL